MQLKLELLPQNATASHIAFQPQPCKLQKFITTDNTNIPKLWSFVSKEKKLEITKLCDLSRHQKTVNVAVWSPNGEYAITACDFPILWKDREPTLMEDRKIPHEISEVLAVEWSPQSNKFLVSSLNKNIVCHYVTEGRNPDKITLDVEARSLVWDPLDKYVAMLCLDNNVTIRMSNNLANVVKKVSLNISVMKFSDTMTKRHERRMGWSPDCDYLMVPSLEDIKEFPIVCSLCRNDDFKTKYVYAGPTASITCISFQDKLYGEDKDKMYSIFAMGDADGNISLWRTTQEDKPIRLIKAGSDDVSIEDICWLAKENMLIASTTKRYMFLIKFEDNYFGTPLSQEKRNEYLKAKYGSATTGNMNFNLFSYKDLTANKSMPIQVLDPFRSESQATLSSTGAAIENSKQMVFTVTNAGKKHLVPVPAGGQASLVPQQMAIHRPSKEQDKDKPKDKEKEKDKDFFKDKEFQKDKDSLKDKEGHTAKDKDKENTDKLDKPSSPKNMKPILNKTMSSGEPKERQKTLTEGFINSELGSGSGDKKAADPSMKPKKKITNPTLDNLAQQYSSSPIICFDKPVPKENSSGYRIGESYMLEIEVKKNLVDGNEEVVSLIKCIGLRTNGRELHWVDQIDGRILLLEYNNQFLVYYTDSQLLYVNQIYSGRKFELPLFIPDLAILKINNKNDMLFIKETGDLRLYNITERAIKLEENCYPLVKNMLGESKPSVDDILLDEEGTPYLILKPNLIIFHDLEMKAWRKVDRSILGLGVFRNVPKPKNFGYQTSTDGFLMLNQTPREKFDTFMKSLYAQDNKKPLDEIGKYNIITKLEEAMLYAIQMNDLKGYMKVVETYLVKLVEFNEYNKLRIFLIEDLHKSSNHKDYIFLTQNEVKWPDLFTHFKETLKSHFSMLNPKVRDILREIDNVIESSARS